MLKNPKYAKKWFPKKDIQRVNRHTTPFVEELAKGNRLYNSPVFAMRRILNGNQTSSEIDLTGIFNEP